MKGDIRIVKGEFEHLPELPTFVKGKSEKYRAIYAVLKEVLDSRRFSQLLRDFRDMVGVSAAIIDLEANVLASSNWERICTDFHRVDARTCERCIESDTELANQLDRGAQFTLYRCKNGLTDCASPIVIEGEHVANLFVGQFLLGPPDRGAFRAQAEAFGFPQGEYLAALEEVSVVEESRLPAIMDFLVHFAQLVAAMGLEKLHEQQLTLAARFGRIVENSLNEVYLFDQESLRFNVVNHGARVNLGYSMEELRALTPLDLKPLFTAEAFDELIRPLREGRRDDLVFETVHRRKDGSVYDVEVHLQLMREETPPVFVAIVQDITERKQLERELRELATSDPLTGIANRRYFLDQLGEEMYRIDRYGGFAALLMLDLDHFKRINDTWGHAAGDQVLRHFTEQVGGRLRETDLIGRLGGEEFAVLLPETTLESAFSLAERIRRRVSEASVSSEKGEIHYTVSIGVTEIAPADAIPDDPLVRADEALYRAKADGRNRVESTRKGGTTPPKSG